MTHRVWARAIALIVTLGALTLGADPAWAQGKTMLVFTSGSDDRSTAIVDAFKEHADFEATKLSFDLGASEEEAYFVAESLQGMEASLIFAVGDTALKVAAREFRGIPIIYADAKAATAAALGREDVVEVEQRVDPVLMMERLRTLMPKVDTVGAIYSSKDRSRYWGLMEQAAQDAGLRFVKAQVASSAEVRNAQVSVTAEAQWLIIQQDGRLWTPTTLSRLFHDAVLDGYPVMSFSLAHLDSPQPPSVVMITDAPGLGLAASQMARQVLADDVDIRQIEPAFPPPIVVGNKRSLHASRVLLTKRTTQAIDRWAK